MSTVRLCLALLVACAITVAAIPAAPADEPSEMLAALRKAKTKEERLAVFKGKDDRELLGFFVKVLTEWETAYNAREFREMEQLLEWLELGGSLITAPGAKTSIEVFSLRMRTLTEQKLGRLDQAAKSYKKLIAQVEKLEQKEPLYKSLRLDILRDYSDFQREQGDYLGGFETIKAALAEITILAPAKRDMLKAQLLTTRGRIQSALHNFIEAEASLKEAARLAKGRDEMIKRIAQRQLAQMYSRANRGEEALDLYAAILLDCQQSKSVMEELETLNALGDALHLFRGDGPAIRRYEEARQLAVKAKMPYFQAAALQNLAGAYFASNADDDAARASREAMEIHRALGDLPELARCKRMLGINELNAGRKAEAEKLFAEALEIANGVGGKQLRAHLAMLDGLLLSEYRQWKQAAERLDTALKLLEDVGDKQELLSVRFLRLRTMVALRDNRLAAEYETFSTESRKLKHLHMEPFVHYIAAKFALSEKRWADAITEAVAGIQIRERHRFWIEDPNLQLSQSSSTLLPDLYGCLTEAYFGQKQYAAAFQTAEQAKSWVLNGLIARSGGVKKGLTPGERADEDKLRNAVRTAAGTAVAQLRTANEAPGKAAALEKALKDAEAAYEVHQTKISLAHPELRAQRGELPEVDLPALQKAVFAREPDLAILSYLVSGDRVLIAVVTASDKPDGPARIVVRTVTVNETELSREAEKFWKACQNRKAGRPLSDDLYKWLIEPVEKDLAGKKHLVIVPSYPLLTLPFQALAADEDSPYLLERFAVSYVPSVSALMAMRKRGDVIRKAGNADRLQVLAVGGAKFTRDLEDLPESGPEAEAVGKTFGDRSRVLLAEKATRPAVLKVMPDARFLHFATHGEINPPRPLFSALAVTPVGKDDDGRLYAHDVMNLNLTAEMVVLSACDSGRGREFRGEGTVGLAWAFFVAGAPTAVVSQWKVSDAATADLMREFYTRLRAGNDPSKAEALRQAALKLLKDKKTQHPAYWAPFVMIGDWRK